MLALIRSQLFVLTFVAASWGCQADSERPWQLPADEPYVLDLPRGLPQPLIPPDQPLTKPRVELGRHLFYDRNLSLNQTTACASCHLQSAAFADPRPHAIGSTGQEHRRNAPSIVNSAYSAVLTWANPLQDNLAEQALLPLFGEFPVELGFVGHEDELISRLKNTPRYQQLFPLAFGASPDPFTLHNMVVALATFERSVISFGSPFDRYYYGGEAGALSDDAHAGYRLFLSEELECHHCHSGFRLDDTTRTAKGGAPEIAFHNTGLYNLDAQGSFPLRDQGLFEISHQLQNMGAFRAPSLRNIALTGPYFHDGSAKTLDDVLEHYARGGRLIESGPDAGDGSRSPLKSGFVQGFNLTDEVRRQLHAFLDALTDESLMSDQRYANPWPQGSTSNPSTEQR